MGQEIAEDLREVKKDLQRSEEQSQHHFDEIQICKQLLEQTRKASESDASELHSELKAHQRHFDVLFSQGADASLENLRLKIADLGQQHHVRFPEMGACLVDLGGKVAEHEEWWASEVADVRQFTATEVGFLKKEVQMVGSELQAMQMSVVHQIG